MCTWGKEHSFVPSFILHSFVEFLLSLSWPWPVWRRYHHGVSSERSVEEIQARAGRCSLLCAVAEIGMMSSGSKPTGLGRHYQRVVSTFVTKVEVWQTLMLFPSKILRFVSLVFLGTAVFHHLNMHKMFVVMLLLCKTKILSSPDHME